MEKEQAIDHLNIQDSKDQIEVQELGNMNIHRFMKGIQKVQICITQQVKK